MSEEGLALLSIFWCEVKTLSKRYLQAGNDYSTHVSLNAAAATGAGTSIDTWDATKGKAHQVIAVLNSSQNGSSIKIEHSDDGTTWSDLISAVSVGTAGASATATEPKRYVRANAVTIGGAGNVTATLLLYGWDRN